MYQRQEKQLGVDRAVAQRWDSISKDQLHDEDIYIRIIRIDTTVVYSRLHSVFNFEYIQCNIYIFICMVFGRSSC